MGLVGLFIGGLAEGLQGVDGGGSVERMKSVGQAEGEWSRVKGLVSRAG
jgi:hypothetical protein